MIEVTAIVLTKNEELSLPDCLKSLEDFARVVVVDSHSTDGTLDIAKAYGAEVVTFTWDGGYPKKKQWSLEHAAGGADWVLLLDADERVSPELAREIARAVTRATVAASRRQAELSVPGALPFARTSSQQAGPDSPVEHGLPGRRRPGCGHHVGS